MTNVGEWTKKEDCWTIVKELEVPSVQQIDRWTISREDYLKEKEQGKKQGGQDDGITAQNTVYDLTSSGYWEALLKWPKLTELLPQAERSLVSKASTIHGFTKINSENDWKKLLKIRQKCEDEGFRRT
jgi:hypothetical protein